MRIISLQELNFFLSQYYSGVLAYRPSISAPVRLMFQTGCRLVEACEVSRWLELSESYILTTAKRNNPRTIEKDWLTIDTIHYLKFTSGIEVDRPQWKFQYTMAQYFSPQIFTIGEKESYNHLFRHRFAKNLKANGKSDSEIKIIMGEKTQIAADQYIYSQIYTNL